MLKSHGASCFYVFSNGEKRKDILIVDFNRDLFPVAEQGVDHLAKAALPKYAVNSVCFATRFELRSCRGLGVGLNRSGDVNSFVDDRSSTKRSLILGDDDDDEKNSTSL